MYVAKATPVCIVTRGTGGVRFYLTDITKGFYPVRTILDGYRITADNLPSKANTLLGVRATELSKSV